MSKRISKAVFQKIPEVNESAVTKMLDARLQDLNKKIIVLDDDPTGVQTVHGVSVYTDWSIESIENGFKETNSMFFLLTNSRGFTAEETEKAHKEIALNIMAAAKKHNQEYMIVSRGDSTLRGHYPLETKVLKATTESTSALRFDGEVIIPFFKEGGRFTIDNVHYVEDNEELIPAGETEFAKDRTFGYAQSHLGKWAEEKSNGEFKAESAVYISLESLRALDIETIKNQLLSVQDFNKVIVNAVDYVDVKIFAIALIDAMRAGKNFMFRSAAAFTKIIGGIKDKGLLSKEELIIEESGNGGLIIIGSHVQKTTDQLAELRKADSIKFIEFDCHLVLDPEKFRSEISRVIETCENLLNSGETVAVYTRRERLDLGEERKEEELKLSVKISEAVTSIVKQLKIRPNYLIAKGGITSSDVGTNGLEVKRAVVAGQIQPGIPVWKTGSESKFPGMPYVVFPGNVGSKTSLREVVERLN
jgi:uncharacterized protein YgbK (DUF1537 family)